MTSTNTSRVAITVGLVMVCLVLHACYSFTGASVPAHLQTINIAEVNVDAQFGNPPLYKQVFLDQLVDEFEGNSTLSLTESQGDATISLSVASITESSAGSAQTETETDRSVTVTVRGEYFDNVKQRELWTKQFTQKTTFSVSGGQAARDEAVQELLEYIAEDVVLAVVSGW